MLAQLRKEAGLSQYELARLAGVPQSNIAYWELSDKPPRSEIIPRLAKLLGVSAESLLNGREVKRKRNGPVGKTKGLRGGLEAAPAATGQDCRARLRPRQPVPAVKN